MNARLQVEHPVTEMVTGLDLVELQIRVAMGEELPLEQSDVSSDGHAIEVRVYAEAPEEGFLPQAGRIEHVRWPNDARVDSGIEEGTEVPAHYDPLLAKLVVHGHDRAAALTELYAALAQTQFLGVRTNLNFLGDVSHDEKVVNGTITTDWLEDAYGRWQPRSEPSAEEMAVAMAAAAETEHVLADGDAREPWSRLGSWRPGGGGLTRIVMRPRDGERAVAVEGSGPFLVEGRWRVRRGRGCHEWFVDEAPAAAARGVDRWFLWVAGAAHEVPVGLGPRRLSDAGPARLDSPLPGQVIAVRVEADERVAEGEELVVVEAMKMEHSIKAPAAGTVRAVLCAPGDQVGRGQALVDFEPDATA
jgi:acetyl/propionyl-CoA carboxylase alpha subunit